MLTMTGVFLLVLVSILCSCHAFLDRLEDRSSHGGGNEPLNLTTICKGKSNDEIVLMGIGHPPPMGPHRRESGLEDEETEALEREDEDDIEEDEEEFEEDDDDDDDLTLRKPKKKKGPKKGKKGKKGKKPKKPKKKKPKKPNPSPTKPPVPTRPPKTTPKPIMKAKAAFVAVCENDNIGKVYFTPECGNPHSPGLRELRSKMKGCDGNSTEVIHTLKVLTCVPMGVAVPSCIDIKCIMGSKMTKAVPVACPNPMDDGCP